MGEYGLCLLEQVLMPSCSPNILQPHRYLDLYEAIEERSLDLLDNSDFADTDIPLEVSFFFSYQLIVSNLLLCQIPLPDQPYLTASQHDEVKEWAQAVSMDQRVEQVTAKSVSENQ